MPLTPGGSRPAAPTPPSTTKQTDEQQQQDKKKTDDGAIILEPQPEDSVNDPLNWPSWRRDTALLSLGFYCMIGGGITSLMAAGFTNIAHDMDVEVETVSLTVGLYMMGLGVGSVLASPTAILFGKRPVYLASVILFIATCVWAGYSSSFSSLLAARVFQGVAVSPVECLPSATIAEIFFLHERAYRIGIYTLLLLGGKNLVPLVSAAIIGRYGWRWVFLYVLCPLPLTLASSACLVLCIYPKRLY
jgi:MFS family permease